MITIAFKTAIAALKLKITQFKRDLAAAHGEIHWLRNTRPVSGCEMR
jgi:hypothetical protein